MDTNIASRLKRTTRKQLPAHVLGWKIISEELGVPTDARNGARPAASEDVPQGEATMHLAGSSNPFYHERKRIAAKPQRLRTQDRSPQEQQPDAKLLTERPDG